MIYRSFYTPDYEPMVTNRLIPSANRVGIDYEFVQRDCLGDHLSNMHAKLGFFIETLAAHPGEPWIWVDADSEFLRDPTDAFVTMEAKGVQLAIPWYRGDRQHRAVMHPISGVVGRWNTSVVFFGSRMNPKMVFEAREWLEKEGRVISGDEVAISHMLADKWYELLKFQDLGLQFSQIFDYPTQAPEPYIIQHQASRKMRAQVGRA